MSTTFFSIDQGPWEILGNFGLRLKIQTLKLVVLTNKSEKNGWLVSFLAFLFLK